MTDEGEMKTFANEIMAAGYRLQSLSADLASDLLAIATIGNQYAVRSEKHKAILDDAKRLMLGGGDPAKVYLAGSKKLRATWPDADAYGVALVALRHVVFGEGST